MEVSQVVEVIVMRPRQWFPGSNSSGSSGGDGEGDGDNNVYNPSSADNNHGKEEEEEDTQHGDKLGGECRVVTMADKEPDEGEPPDNNNEPVPEKIKGTCGHQE